MSTKILYITLGTETSYNIELPFTIEGHVTSASLIHWKAGTQGEEATGNDDVIGVKFSGGLKTEWITNAERPDYIWLPLDGTTAYAARGFEIPLQAASIFPRVLWVDKMTEGGLPSTQPLKLWIKLHMTL